MRVAATMMVTLTATLVASASAASSSANRKPVTSLLTAKWASTPFHLEMSEFVADEDNGAFWEMVDFFVEEQDSIGRSLSDRDERILKSSLSHLKFFHRRIRTDLVSQDVIKLD